MTVDDLRCIVDAVANGATGHAASLIAALDPGDLDHLERVAGRISVLAGTVRHTGGAALAAALKQLEAR